MSIIEKELTRNFCPKCLITDKNKNPLYCTKCGNSDLIPTPPKFDKMEEMYFGETLGTEEEGTDFKFGPQTGQVSGACPNISNIPQHEETIEENLAPQIDPDILEKLKQPFAFITGAAGTGKTFCVRMMAENDPKYIELCSTTGIAAVNLGGRTINSVLKYYNTKSLELAYDNGKLQWALRRIRISGKRVLGIEEVSMLDAKQLDYICAAVDEINNDTSGKTLGIHLIGDFSQLPPVNAEFAFKSQFWDRFEQNTIQLKKIWRQDNADFISAMNYARAGDGNSCVTQLLDCGVRFTKEEDKNFDGTTLIAINMGVDSYNENRLKDIKSPMIRTVPRKQGLQLKEWTKLIPVELRLKVGAYVMILANDIPAFNYVNGDAGYIKSYDPKSDKFEIELIRNSRIVRIGRIMRENVVNQRPEDGAIPYFTSYADPKNTGDWVVGNISFHPLKLGWASSIHKAQGLTLDRVQIDTRANFFSFPSMGYVALSRARNPAGLMIIGNPADVARKIKVNPEVRRWI